MNSRKSLCNLSNVVAMVMSGIFCASGRARLEIFLWYSQIAKSDLFVL
ncbi:hypothetical protein [Helicobacter mustelae]|nr:hypothetical protein [Helicobacter mustelae]